ncbi:hypothetical protein KFU94_26985 [Chloroflexi bacterium TSY]|nr:hypothetical protein [Chloroflexi bacterium TSY]
MNPTPNADTMSLDHPNCSYQFGWLSRLAWVLPTPRGGAFVDGDHNMGRARRQMPILYDNFKREITAYEYMNCGITLLSGKGLSDKGQTERGGKKNPP